MRPYRFHFAATHAMAERNALIFMLFGEGHSRAAIGRLLGISGTRVGQIISNGKAFSATPLSAATS